MSDQQNNGKPSTPEKKTPDAADPELDDLLNSALEDFDKLKVKSEDNVDPSASVNNPDLGWDQQFLSQAKFFDTEMAAMFEQAGVKNLPTSGDLTQGLARMAEAAARVAEGNVSADVEPQMVDSITQALRGLKEGTDNLQSVLGPEEMANMFSGLDMNDGESDDLNPFMPFMQGMMQSLLSAEVLLPSLKELNEKYPAWLEENKDTVSQEDKERYTKQQELFKTVIAELEQEKPDDVPAVKNERFKKVLELMQKLHAYGQPPAELVGVDGGAIPSIPPGMEDPSQCSVM